MPDVAKPISVMPEEMVGVTHKFDIAGHEGYINIGEFENGQPRFVHITMAKEGSTLGGLVDSLGLAITIGLEHGVPLRSYADQLIGLRFEPCGFTNNSRIQMARSIVDYIIHWMAMKYIPGWPDGDVDDQGKLRLGDIQAVQKT